jgi:hypothetical protein
MIALLLTAALAGDAQVVRQGDTIESIAAGLDGGPAAVRAANGLGDDAQPIVGSVLRLGGPDMDVPGVVCSTSGTGTATTAGGTVVDLVRGLELPAGSHVCTGERSYATLCLARSDTDYSHDMVTMFPGTCVAVEAAFSAPERRTTVVSLEKGGVSVGARGQTTSGDVTIRTLDGVTAGRMGGFRVTLEPDATRTEAVTAPVSVFGDATQVEVPAGFGSRVSAGRAPVTPTALLPSGALSKPDDGEALRIPEFSWPAVARSVGYRVELATTSDFVDIVQAETVPEAHWAPEVLFLPYRVPGLWWRVAAYDSLGFLGVPSEARALRFPVGVGP